MNGKKLLLASSLLVSMLAGCSTKSKEWTVSFDVDSISPQTVKDGETLTKPADPVKADTAGYHYTFAYWAKDGSEYDFSSPVHEDFTLEAKWEEQIRQYNVTFLDTDGTTVLQTSAYDYGATPVYSGKALTKDSTDEFDYALNWSPAIAPVSGDATYTATFVETKRKYQVTFDSDGGSAIDTQAIEYGAKATAPTDPVKSTEKGNYEFLGWYLGDDLYDFGSEVKGAVSLKAKWGNKLYKNATKNADGTVTISKMTYAGSKTEGFSVTPSYVAFEGDYGVGTTLGFRFTGKNIPNIGLFASDIGSPIGNANGIYVSSGTTDSTLLGRLTVYGPHMLETGNPSDYSEYNGIGYDDRLVTQTDSSFGYNNLEDDKDYLYKVTTSEASSGVQLALELNEVKADGTMIGLASFNTAVTYAGEKTGNLIVYGSFVDDITLKIMDLNSEIPTPDIVTYKSSLNGNEVTLNAGTRTDDSYLGLKAGVTVGDTVKISYTGKNLPNVALLCDSNNGQAVGGGQGIYLANSFVTGLTDGNASRLMPYGPYRWAINDKGSGLTTYRYPNSADGKMGYTNMEDGISYEFTIKVDSIVDDTVKITINLKNVTANTNVTNRTITLDSLNAKLETGDTLNLGDNVIFYGHEKAVTFTYEFIKGEK